MSLADLGKTIVKFGSPILGAVVGGPAGASIGQLVANAFGGDLDNTDQLIQKMILDPDTKIKLSEIQSNEKIELQKLLVAGERQRLENENRRIELINDNTKDAREENGKQQTYYPQFLSTLIVMGFFASIYWIAAYTQQKADHDVLYLLLGVIGTSFSGVVNYWLGSSAEKNFDLKK